MTTVPASYADWLRNASLIATAAQDDGWGDLALASEVRCCFANEADAQAEADRQHAFFGVARVVETVWVPGDHSALYGQTVSLTADHPGYRDGAIVFVVSVQERADGGTALGVIRRLA